MILSNDYIAVTKVGEEVKPDEFSVVTIQDSSTFKGKVHDIPEIPVFIGNRKIEVNDIVMFKKYSPDTHDIVELGLKFIRTSDILAVL